MPDDSCNSDKKLDTTNENPTYWDKILQKMHLGMGRGKRNWLSYRGDMHKTIHAEESKFSGKVKPSGHHPDS